MESNALPLSAGWRWFINGWELFKKSPVQFLIGTIIWLALELGIAFIPIAGPMIDGFIFPMLYAGFLNFASLVDSGKPAQIKDFFVPLLNPKLLIQFSFLGLIIVGFELLSVAFASSLGAIAVAIFLPMAVVMVSSLIFSVPLILFNDIKFHLALKSSIQSCGKNFAVMVVMYFILLGFMVISAISYGVGLLIIIPLTFCGLYLGYRQAFKNQA